MHIFHLIVTGIFILMVGNAGIGAVLHAQYVAKVAAEVGVLPAQLPLLGVLKLAGAIGLLLGLLNVPYIGIAAAIGLVIYFIGAIVAHLRAHVLYNIYGPGIYLTLAVLTLVTWPR
jgi:hypothetical protein